MDQFIETARKFTPKQRVYVLRQACTMPRTRNVAEKLDRATGRCFFDGTADDFPFAADCARAFIRESREYPVINFALDALHDYLAETTDGVDAIYIKSVDMSISIRSRPAGAAECLADGRTLYITTEKIMGFAEIVKNLDDIAPSIGRAWVHDLLTILCIFLGLGVSVVSIYLIFVICAWFFMISARHDFPMD